MKAKVIVSDCIEAMKKCPDNSVEAVVADPPYDLTASARGSTPGSVSASKDVFARVKAGGFMGLSWDAQQIAFDVNTWKDVYRILKPGGYLVSFGGSRTCHRMACAIEDAGFELRENCVYLYGSGMPKGLNISKQFDKVVGAKRKVVKTASYTRASDASFAWQDGEHKSEAFKAGEHSYDVTEPSTDLAKRWDGWNTTLKPAFEMIIVARKPMIGTVLENILRYDTGAINIDACRIEAVSRPLRDDVEYHPNSLSGRVDGSLQSSKAVGGTDLGRWPSNVVLGHSDGCRQIGVREVPYDDGVDRPRKTGSSDVVGHFGFHNEAQGTHNAPGSSGLREVWECVEDCPVRLLDAQSGERKSGGVVLGTEPSRTGQNGIYGTWDRVANKPFADEGGASRFFLQVKPNEEADRWGSPVDRVSRDRDEPVFSLRADLSDDVRSLIQDFYSGYPQLPESDSNTLELLRCDIPTGWLSYFEDTNRPIRSPEYGLDQDVSQDDFLSTGAPEASTDGAVANSGPILPIEDGTQNRFFYTSKSSRRERNEGLGSAEESKFRLRSDLTEEQLEFVQAELERRGVV